MAKKVYSSIVLCTRKVLVRSVQVLCINEVIATKKVTEKVKKLGKIAILRLFLSHRGCHMAPRLQKHEYLLVTKFWTEFEHFRMSGSIICSQLFLSLTRCFKGTSFFGNAHTYLSLSFQLQQLPFPRFCAYGSHGSEWSLIKFRLTLIFDRLALFLVDANIHCFYLLHLVVCQIVFLFVLIKND